VYTQTHTAMVDANTGTAETEDRKTDQDPLRYLISSVAEWAGKG